MAVPRAAMRRAVWGAVGLPVVRPQGQEERQGGGDGDGVADDGGEDDRGGWCGGVDVAADADGEGVHGAEQGGVEADDGAQHETGIEGGRQCAVLAVNG